MFDLFTLHRLSQVSQVCSTYSSTELLFFPDEDLRLEPNRFLSEKFECRSCFDPFFSVYTVAVHRFGSFLVVIAGAKTLS